MNRRQLLLTTGTLSTALLAGCTGQGSGGQNGPSTEERPEFEVRVESFEQEVKQGETLTVHFSVENTGERTDTQTVQFNVDGAAVDSLQDVQLQGDESVNDQFTYTTGSGDPPEVEFAIVTAQETARRTVLVESRPPVEALELGITDVRNISTGLTSATIPVFLAFENTHSEQEIPSPTVDYTGYINGEEVVSNRQVIPSIEPGDTLTKEFPFTVKYADLGSAVVTAIQDGSFTIRITGTIESEDTSIQFDESYQY